VTDAEKLRRIAKVISAAYDWSKEPMQTVLGDYALERNRERMQEIQQNLLSAACVIEHREAYNHPMKLVEAETATR